MDALRVNVTRVNVTRLGRAPSRLPRPPVSIHGPCRALRRRPCSAAAARVSSRLRRAVAARSRSRPSTACHSDRHARDRSHAQPSIVGHTTSRFYATAHAFRPTPARTKAEGGRARSVLRADSKSKGRSRRTGP